MLDSLPSDIYLENAFYTFILQRFADVRIFLFLITKLSIKEKLVSYSLPEILVYHHCHHLIVWYIVGSITKMCFSLNVTKMETF